MQVLFNSGFFSAATVDILDHVICGGVCPVHCGLFTETLTFFEPSVSHWRRQWHPTPVLLPGKSHGWQSLVGCRPQDSDTTERLPFHFSLSCVGEGNGNPLQCSCLRNPRDGEAWWASVYGVAQSRTRLKRLSSSNSNVSQPYKALDITVGDKIIHS